MSYNVALVGNPNCGKTTLFNSLTGSKQYVGNWSGVTVEKKSGKLKGSKLDIRLTDLPGIYSLSPYSMEEMIARDFIIKEKPDLIINIIDGTNIERNLYLTIQILELGLPVVIAINMMDDVKARGEKIDCDRLGEELSLKVIPIVARKNQNLDELIKVCEAELSSKQPHDYKIVYNKETSRAMNDIDLIVGDNLKETEKRFYLSKLLEGDPELEKDLNLSPSDKDKLNTIVKTYEAQSEYGDRETMVADARYQFITSLVSKHIKKKSQQSHLTLTDKIDMFVTNRFLAIPIFLVVISFVFGVTFGPIGSGLKNGVSFIINNFITEPVNNILTKNQMPQWTYGLLIDALIKGVGTVLEFLPQIVILFLFLSILEDSGYMARAAFIMDRFFRKLGLNGKSFIPMLMGFGCTTPAVMAARTMENEREKRLTILLIPFMPCGAKLTVFMFLTSIFFKEHQGLIIFSLYFIGLIMAIITGVILKNIMFKNNTSNFIMELPPYRWPTTKTIMLHVWEKCKGFLIKAGTIIFSMCILIWILENFNFKLNYVTSSEMSMIGYIGRFIAPIFKPLGFGQWKACVALIAGLIAKESVISTMKILYNGNLLNIFSQPAAIAYMVFILLYMPCVSAFVSMKKELGSWKWAMKAALIEFGSAYFVSLIIYNLLRVII